MDKTTLTRDVVRALRQVYDPEIPVDTLVEDVHTAVADTPGVTDVAIEITFDPPWDKSRMSDEALLELGLL